MVDIGISSLLSENTRLAHVCEGNIETSITTSLQVSPLFGLNSKSSNNGFDSVLQTFKFLAFLDLF